MNAVFNEPSCDGRGPDGYACKNKVRFKLHGDEIREPFTIYAKERFACEQHLESAEKFMRNHKFKGWQQHTFSNSPGIESTGIIFVDGLIQ